MKVIFLDVDGVLNSTRKSEVILTVLTRRIRRKLLPDFPVYNIFGVRTHLVRKLKKIVDKTNAVVVLSSTWRGDFFSPKEERKKKWTSSVLNQHFPTLTDLILLKQEK